MTITCYDSIEDTIDTVMKVKQDETYLAMDSATMAIRDDNTNRLMMEESYGDGISCAVAVNCNQSYLLYSNTVKRPQALAKARSTPYSKAMPKTWKSRFPSSANSTITRFTLF